MFVVGWFPQEELFVLNRTKYIYIYIEIRNLPLIPSRKDSQQYF